MAAPHLNTYSDVSAIANAVQDDAIFVLRETAQMQNVVQTFTDLTGANPRKGYQYNAGTAISIGETDDLTSSAFTPALDQTLTPGEIGEQFFISDLRAESELPESILADASMELGMAAGEKVEQDLVDLMASLTGGTVGQAGTTISWSLLANAIAIARFINKANSKPLVAAVSGYQWNVLAKSASIAGATTGAATGFTEEMTRTGFVARFSGVPVMQLQRNADSSDDFTGGVFPREAMAIDWRRFIRIRAERDESRRGVELNMSGVYAKGVWRPNRGVKLIADSTAPTG